MVHRFALLTGVSLRSGLRKGLQWLTLAAMLTTECFAQQPDDLLEEQLVLVRFRRLPASAR